MKKLIIFIIFLLSSFLEAQSELPIVAFGGVKTGKVSDFKTFKNAGFNLSIDVYENTDDILNNLNAAEKSSVKLFIYSDSLMLFPKIVNKIKNHPAFYGTYVADEPQVNHFPMLEWRIKGIKEYDKNGKFYINLFPNYASNEQLGANSYKEYLEKFINTVSVEFISFDYYPIKNNQIEASWYENLEDIRNLSIKYNKPFWGFANSTIFQQYKNPTLGGLKLQQFSNLLYGAKGLQYFTYWTVDKEYRLKNNFQHSIVYEDGTLSPIYKLVKELNTQIHNLEWIFLRSKVTRVYHDGKTVPKGTEKLQRLPSNFSSFNSTKESILISYLETPKSEFVIVQNKDINKSITFRYQPKIAMQIINSFTGESSIISTKMNNTSILPGDLLIFKKDK